MSKSQPILQLIGTAAKGAYDRAEAATTAKAAAETQSNAKQWNGADADLTTKADDAITAAGDAYNAFNTIRDTKHKEDLVAIGVMVGDTTGDVLALIDADNQLDVLLGQREAEYASAFAEEGATVEGDITQFLAIFNA